MTTHARALAALASTAVLTSLLAVPGTSLAAPTLSAIPNTRPTWTAQATRLGPASGTTAVHARVYLAPRGGLASLAAFATAASTPGNSTYHRFLAARQYHARFDATADTVSAVSDYLHASGLRVTETSAHNRYLTVRGTVAEAEHAFGTDLQTYRRDGVTVDAPSSSLTVPAALAADIITVTGLDTSPRRAAPTATQAEPAPPGVHGARPCSTYFGQLTAKYKADFTTALPKFDGRYLSYAPCGYFGSDLAEAYEGGTVLDGSGVSVGIVGAYAASTMARDANTYSRHSFQGSYRAGQFTQVLPSAFNDLGDEGDWNGEETLDVEAVHAMAPGADIRWYAAKSSADADLLDALQKAVDQDTVRIISNSWTDLGEEVPVDEIRAVESTVLQGAAEGISVLFASGDNGEAAYPATDPYVTAVGGTSIGIDENDSVSMQTGWGTEDYQLVKKGKAWKLNSPYYFGGFVYGSGGGTSTLFDQPAYQAKATHSSYRQVPDVAMDADPDTGMLVGETQAFPGGRHYDEYRIGGTSLAAPLFAGMTALSLQHEGGTGAGLLDPTIYANTKAFTDILPAPRGGGVVRVDYANNLDATHGTVYAVRTFGQDRFLKVTKGYDPVTGIGAPNPSWLTAICASG